MELFDGGIFRECRSVTALVIAGEDGEPDCTAMQASDGIHRIKPDNEACE